MNKTTPFTYLYGELSFFGNPKASIVTTRHYLTPSPIQRALYTEGSVSPYELFAIEVCETYSTTSSRHTIGYVDNLKVTKALVADMDEAEPLIKELHDIVQTCSDYYEEHKAPLLYADKDHQYEFAMRKSHWGHITAYPRTNTDKWYVDGPGYIGGVQCQLLRLTNKETLESKQVAMSGFIGAMPYLIISYVDEILQTAWDNSGVSIYRDDKGLIQYKPFNGESYWSKCLKYTKKLKQVNRG